MSQVINNSIGYNTVTENELAVLLASFETSYIYNVINDNITHRYDAMFVDIVKPNAVNAFELNFKNLLEQFPMDKENIKFVRSNTYEEIIQLLCKAGGLAISPNYETMDDHYTAAYYLYDLIVSNFTNNITQFFCNYIYREKTNLYNYFNLDYMKKNKDSATLYGKKVYEDPKIAVINANLVYILDQMQAFDISFNDICTVLYPDPNVVNMLTTNFVPQVDFYKTFYCEPFRNPNLAAMFITAIRLEIQRRQTGVN